MGANNSAEGRRMNNDSDNSEPVGEASDRLSGEDLPAIVEYLIRSGQFRFISQSGDDSDSDGYLSDGDTRIMTATQPEVVANPDVAEIKKSDIYTSVLQSSGRLANRRWLHYVRPTLPNMIGMNQLGMNPRQQLTTGEYSVLNSRFLPNYIEQQASYNRKAFCGKYSDDGRVFMTACQDQRIRVYDTEDDRLSLVKSIEARDVGWSVLDTAFSPDGCYAAYSSWSDCVHLCSIFGDYDVHEALHFEPGEHSFCIFSLMFSSDNGQILGGANDGHIYVYDREANKRSLKIQAHDDDVNTVRFANTGSQILYSGGDDGLCKVWDRRTLREEHPTPVGTMAGHSDGITFIDSKGDGRYFISNSKDQTLKLWDVRYFSQESGIAETRKLVASQRWDYRWERVPRKAKKKKVRGDSSVMTYMGHCILHTLIRCRFSPEFNTGQRYIYSGCATGKVVVYDVLTGQMLSNLDGHSSCVRDVDWHPYKNILLSTSWDGAIGQWTYRDSAALDCEPGEKPMETPEPAHPRERSSRLRRSVAARMYPMMPKLTGYSKNEGATKLKGLFD